MMTQTEMLPPTLEDLERLAADSYARIPEAFRRMTGEIIFRVEDFPEQEVCAELQLESPFDLLGLYQGVDLARKSGFDTLPRQDMIFLYRRPILDYWIETGGELGEIVRHVLVHEIGHHFGLSDEDMARIESEV